MDRRPGRRDVARALAQHGADLIVIVEVGRELERLHGAGPGRGASAPGVGGCGRGGPLIRPGASGHVERLGRRERVRPRRHARGPAGWVRRCGHEGVRQGRRRRERARRSRATTCVVQDAPVEDRLERPLAHHRLRVVIVVVVERRLGGRPRGGPHGGEARPARAVGRLRAGRVPPGGSIRRWHGRLRLVAEGRPAHHRADLFLFVMVGRALVLERRERAHRHVRVPLLEGAPERSHAGGTEPRIALEDVVEDVLEVVVADVEDRQRRRRGVGDALPGLGVCRAAERARSGERLVEGRGDPPDVVERREAAPRGALRALVREAARRRADVEEDALRRAIGGGQKDALRREAAVRDPEGVERLDSPREADGPADGIELVERPIARDSIGERFHGSAQA